MKSPTFSIITPSYNQGQFIEETIKSVLGQEGDFYIDYVIVDGGSTDNSVEIIKKYEQLLKEGEWPGKCRGIKYRWVSEKDKGQSDAVNKGLRMCSGEIIGWLNSDDTYYPNALNQAAKLINPSKGIYIVMGRCAFIDETGRPTDKEHPTAFVDHKRVVKIWKGYYSIPQPAVFFHKDVYEKCGGLDESLYFAMDYDLFLRFTKYFNIYIANELCATYRLHSASKSKEISSGELLENSIKISKRYWGPRYSISYWKYLLSYSLYGGKIGVISLKRLCLAEKSFNENDALAFLWNLFMSFVLFPPTILRYLILPRVRKIIGISASPRSRVQI